MQKFQGLEKLIKFFNLRSLRNAYANFLFGVHTNVKLLFLVG
jgi:hypothetical protein